MVLVQHDLKCSTTFDRLNAHSSTTLMNGVNEGDNCAAPMQQPHAKYDGNYTMTNAGVLHVRETGTTDVICVYCTAKIGELPNSHHHLDTGSNVTSFPRTNIS